MFLWPEVPFSVGAIASSEMDSPTPAPLGPSCSDPGTLLQLLHLLDLRQRRQERCSHGRVCSKRGAFDHLWDSLALSSLDFRCSSPKAAAVSDFLCPLVSSFSKLVAGSSAESRLAERGWGSPPLLAASRLGRWSPPAPSVLCRLCAGLCPPRSSALSPFYSPSPWDGNCDFLYLFPPCLSTTALQIYHPVCILHFYLSWTYRVLLFVVYIGVFLSQLRKPINLGAGESEALQQPSPFKGEYIHLEKSFYEVSLANSTSNGVTPLFS